MADDEREQPINTFDLISQDEFNHMLLRFKEVATNTASACPPVLAIVCILLFFVFVVRL